MGACTSVPVDGGKPARPSLNQAPRLSKSNSLSKNKNKESGSGTLSPGGSGKKDEKDKKGHQRSNSDRILANKTGVFNSSFHSLNSAPRDNKDKKKKLNYGDKSPRSSAKSPRDNDPHAAFDHPVDEVREEQREWDVLSRLTHFDKPTLLLLQKCYDKISESKTNDGLIDREEFCSALGLPPKSALASAMFSTFDIAKAESLNFRVFARSMSVLSDKATHAEKARFLFDMCDLNRDGLISADELQMLLSSALRDTDIGLSLTDEQIAEICVATIKQVDTNNDGVINYDEFCKMLDSKPSFYSIYTLNVERLLNPDKAPNIMSPADVEDRMNAARANNTDKDVDRRRATSILPMDEDYHAVRIDDHENFNYFNDSGDES